MGTYEHVIIFQIPIVSLAESRTLIPTVDNSFLSFSLIYIYMFLFKFLQTYFHIEKSIIVTKVFDDNRYNNSTIKVKVT